MISRFLHRVRHWLNWQPITVVTEWRGPELWVGAECVKCGEVSGWHASRHHRRVV